MPLSEFIELRYFPGMKNGSRPSTIHNYRVVYLRQAFEDAVGKIRLAGAGLSHGTCSKIIS